MRLYIVRHGKPDYKLDCLVEEGQEQAYLVAQRFKNIKIDKIYSSTQGRAIETASYTAKDHNMEIIMADWAREDYGGKYFYDETGWFFFKKDWVKRFKSETMIKYGHDWINDEKVQETRMPIGFKEMQIDSDKFLLELGYKHDRNNHTYEKLNNDYENVFLFAHGGFCISFLSSILDIPYPIFSTTHHDLDFTGVVIVEFNEKLNLFQIRTYNDVSHLRK